MEAGGIEPPSRDGAEAASTCLVDLLFLGSSGADRQAPSVPSPTDFSPRVGQTSTQGQPAIVVAPASGRHRCDGQPV